MMRLNPDDFIAFCKDKLVTYRFLREKGYNTPETCRYSEADRVLYLRKHNNIVLKPVDAEKGRGVFFEAVSSAHRDIDYINYILQEKIDTFDFSGYTFDVRVFVQNTKERSINMYSRVSSDFITNIDRGARVEDTQKILKACFPERDADIFNNILATAEKLTQDLAESFHFFEFGIDILIDKHGGLHIIELNSQCGLSGFFRLSKPKDFQYGDCKIRYAISERQKYRDIIKTIYKNRIERFGKERMLDFIEGANFSMAHERDEIKQFIDNYGGIVKCAE